MRSKTGQLMHAGAEEVIEEIDSFIAGGNQSKTVTTLMPQVITIPPFKGRSLKARIANKITRIPLRLVRKSTKDYYLYQKNINHELKHELESLRYQVQKLRKELNDRK